jgi:UDP-N-acetylmuramoylalanine--D-glutamate ligase
MDRVFFKDKKVLAMGLGRFGGGVDTVKFACQAGAKVIVTDLALQEELADSINQLKNFGDIEYHLDGHIEKDFEQADIVVANPAVPNDNKFLEIARRAGRFVTSQINIFFQLCPAVIIGVTGANGKSTTAALTAHLLRGGYESRVTSHGPRVTVWLSGNIGNEPLLAIIDQIGKNDLVVLEISSFQIEQLAQISKMPRVALLTNLTPNHLDRYGTFENYCAAKENIFKYQRPDESRPAVSIFNAEDRIGAQWFEKYSEDKSRICIKFSASDVSEKILASYALPGRANLENLAAAMAIATHFGVREENIKKHLSEFKALPHRLELIATIKGVQWYNDSKATTPEAAIVALDAFEQPEIIIAGGYDKHTPFDKLGEKIAQKARAAILLGQTAGKIADAIKKTQDSRQQTEVRFAGSLAEAVQTANELAVDGDVVLLSPACASYDMFDNFQQRGQEFAELVNRLGD